MKNKTHLVNTKILLSILFVSPLFLHADIATSTATIQAQQEATTTSTSTAATTIQQTDSYTLCAQKAIEKRDTDILDAREKYNDSVKHAIEERKEGLKNALTAPNQKETKDDITQKYKNAQKIAQSNYTNARKEIWSTFEKSMDECKKIKKENLQKEAEARKEDTLRKKDEAKTNDEKNGVKKSLQEEIRDWKDGMIKRIQEIIGGDDTKIEIKEDIKNETGIKSTTTKEVLLK